MIMILQLINNPLIIWLRIIEHEIRMIFCHWNCMNRVEVIFWLRNRKKYVIKYVIKCVVKYVVIYR